MIEASNKSCYFGTNVSVVVRNLGFCRAGLVVLVS